MFMSEYYLRRSAEQEEFKRRSLDEYIIKEVRIG